MKLTCNSDVDYYWSTRTSGSVGSVMRRAAIFMHRTDSVLRAGLDGEEFIRSTHFSEVLSEEGNCTFITKSIRNRTRTRMHIHFLAYGYFYTILTHSTSYLLPSCHSAAKGQPIYFHVLVASHSVRLGKVEDLARSQFAVSLGQAVCRQGPGNLPLG